MKSNKLYLFFVTNILISLSLKGQQIIYDTITHDSLQRNYIVYVPASYNSANPMPLVISFHGYGSNATNNFNASDFNGIADTAGFIVVYPQGALRQGSTHWNVGGWVFGSTVDDLGFTDALIDTVSSNYSVDSNRIYSVGISNGGYMSILLACQLSHRIAAVAAIAGSMTFQTFNACNPQHPTPLMQIHGTADGFVPYNGNIFWTKSINAVLQYWSSYNNCCSAATTINLPDLNTTDSSTVEYSIYNGGDNGTTVEHYKVVGGGHTWPGLGSGNMDIHASKEIWKFFNKYDLNGSINNQNNCTDTTFVTYYDTTFVTVYDSIFILDTNYVTIYDTVTHYDSLLVSVTDTLIININLSSFSSPNISNTLRIYPNPAVDIVLIDNGNFNSMSDYSLKILNSLGQEVFNSFINTAQFQIPIINFGGVGLYHIKLYDNAGSLIDTRKLIIQ